MLVFFIGLLAVSFLIPEAPIRAAPKTTIKLGQIVRQPTVLAFLLVCLLVQASHGPYYTFFTIQAEAVGYSGGLIGFFWALGVLAEVGVFIAVPLLLPRYGARFLLLLTLLLTTLRWILSAYYVTTLPVLLFAQCLHGFSFGMYHAVAISLIHRYFTGPYQGRGQALLSSVGFGIGGALGSVLAGQSWQALGPTASYLGAASFAFAAWLIAWRWLR
jgi:PPP family 3-phenylpropionic acid transporter